LQGLCLVLVGAPAVAAGRRAEVGVEVAGVRERDAVAGLGQRRRGASGTEGALRDARRVRPDRGGDVGRREGAKGTEGALADERGLLDGERRDGVLGVEVVVEERLALGRLLHRLLADEHRRGELRLHLGELRLERDDLRRLVARLGRHREEVHRARHRHDRARAAELLHAARRRALLGRHVERGEGVLARQQLAALRRLRLERHLRLDAPGRRRLLLAAPQVAGLELRAVVRRVPLLVAVSALVLEQLRAAHLALRPRRVLDEVARELRLGQPLGVAEGAELGVALGSGLGSGLGARHVSRLEGV